MPFDDLQSRQAEATDFKVNLLRFEGGGARISVGIKEPNVLVRKVLVEVSPRNFNSANYSPWDDFYSRIDSGPVLNQIPDDEISYYIPASPEGNDYVWPTDKLLEDGQFVIPLNTDIYFWVYVPASYRKSENGDISDSFVGYPYIGQFDSKNQTNNLRLDFGTVVPGDTPHRKNQITQVWSYAFHVPIFKINVKQGGVDIQYYEIGECLYFSEFCERQPNLMNFKRISSYYD